MVFGKQGKISGMGIVVLLVGAYMFVMPFQTAVNNLFAGIGQPELSPTTNGVTVGQSLLDRCIEHDTITMTVGPMQRKWKVGTAVTNEWARVFVDGTDLGLKQDSATVSVSYGDPITIYYAENSSIYYAAKQEFTVPCTAAFRTADPTLDGDVFELYPEATTTNLNLKFFDEDDGLLNEGMGGTAGTNETMAAGDSVNLEGSVQGIYEQAYSPYGKVLITLLYNSSGYQVPSLVANGVTDETTPTFRVNSNSSSGFSFKTWGIPGIISNEKRDLTLTMSTKDDKDPGAGATADGTKMSSQLDFFIDDEDWTREDDGSMSFGAEDGNDANVGQTNNTYRNYRII